MKVPANSENRIAIPNGLFESLKVTPIQNTRKPEVDVSNLEPQVACPSSVDNVKPISELGDVPINQAFIGSCTNGRLEDLKKQLKS